jgi:hypothetical protein
MFDFFRPAEPSNTKLGERNESEHSNTVDVSTEVVVSNDDKSIVDKSESITITESVVSGDLDSNLNDDESVDDDVDDNDRHESIIITENASGDLVSNNNSVQIPTGTLDSPVEVDKFGCLASDANSSNAIRTGRKSKKAKNKNENNDDKGTSKAVCKIKLYEKGRKYKTEWEKSYPWVERAQDGEMAFCKICKKTLKPKKTSLNVHEKSSTHVDRKQAMNLSKPIKLKRITVAKKVKVAELELAAGIACHCSMLAVDHIGEIIMKNGTGSVLGNISLHRTKCTRLITEVISPSFIEQQKHDYQNINGYSLLVDEATDIACDKHIAILMRYYNERLGKIETILLGMQPVVETTGEALFEAIKKQASESDIDLARCIGYGSDGCSNMVGENNSLWSRIQDISPNCIQMKCICHSLALCVKHGFEKLPSNIGFIASEIPKWFRKSTLRREAYKTLFSVMNPNEEASGRPSPFQKLSTTRWLVRGKVMYNILVNWDELAAYFACCRDVGTQDVRYKARLLSDMLRDEVNRCYFEFVVPIIQEFEKMNSFFQAEKIDPGKVMKEMDIFHRALKSRMYLNDGRMKPKQIFDYGCKFLLKLNGLENAENRNIVRDRCADMLLELLEQVDKRMPQNRQVFDSLGYLTPEIVLSHTKREPFNKLPMKHVMGDDNRENVEIQYRRIVCEDWTIDFSGDIPSDSELFWSMVYKLPDGHYKDLAKYALTCLATPLSNAIVERIFSLVTSTKTKTRNRMSLATLTSILRIKTVLGTGCCKELEVTENMLRKFDSSIYKNKDDQAQASHNSLDLEMDVDWQL